MGKTQLETLQHPKQKAPNLCGRCPKKFSEIHRVEIEKNLCLLKVRKFTMGSGQIIATSHDRFPPNGGLVREIPLFQGNPGSPGPKCVPAVGPSGLNVGGVGAMVRSSIVESS